MMNDKLAQKRNGKGTSPLHYWSWWPPILLLKWPDSRVVCSVNNHPHRVTEWLRRKSSDSFLPAPNQEHRIPLVASVAGTGSTSSLRIYQYCWLVESGIYALWHMQVEIATIYHNGAFCRLWLNLELHWFNDKWKPVNLWIFLNLWVFAKLPVSRVVVILPEGIF